MPLPKSKHYLCIVGVVFAAPLFAADAEDAIAACARIASTGDRILCLEEALRRLSPDGQYQTDLPEIDDEVLVSEDVDAPDEVIAESAAPAAAAIDATAGSASSAPPAKSAPTVELGTEQVARQNDVEEEQVRISAKIVDHTLVGTGRLRIRLDNGQVWQQTGDDDDRIARRIRGQTDIAVEMWQSRSGGYRMHLVEVDRTLRVRRIR